MSAFRFCFLDLLYWSLTTYCWLRRAPWRKRLPMLSHYAIVLMYTERLLIDYCLVWSSPFQYLPIGLSLIRGHTLLDIGTPSHPGNVVPYTPRKIVTLLLEGWLTDRNIVYAYYVKCTWVTCICIHNTTRWVIITCLHRFPDFLSRAHILSRAYISALDYYLLHCSGHWFNWHQTCRWPF